MNADEIKRLTEQLKTNEDISLEEADWIYSLFSRDAMYTTLHPSSPKFNSELSQALQEWYEVVAQKIRNGERGNFVFTVYLKNIIYSDFPYPAKKALLEQGDFKDLCNVIMVDEKIYSALPFKHLFTKRLNDFTKRLNDSTSKPYYKMTSRRAGMLYYPIEIDGKTYTAGGLLKHLFPVATLGSPEDANHHLSREAFEVMVGAGRVVSHTLVLSQYEVKLFTLAAFMRYKDFSCVAALDAYNSAFVTFTEKDKAPIIKDVLEVPFEELVQNAVRERVIDKKTAKTLLDNYPVMNFPLKDFTEVSIRYIDNVVRLKAEWKKTRKAIEDENTWLEIIR